MLIFWPSLRRMALIIMMIMTPVPANFVIAIGEEPWMKFVMHPMVNVSACQALVETALVSLDSLVQHVQVVQVRKIKEVVAAP